MHYAGGDRLTMATLRNRSQGPLEGVSLCGARVTATIRIFACAEIVVPIPSYAKISGPDADAKSGADPDDHCRHRQAYGKGDGNHGHDCKKQIFFGLHLVEFRHGLHHTVFRGPRASGARLWLTKP